MRSIYGIGKCARPQKIASNDQTRGISVWNQEPSREKEVVFYENYLTHFMCVCVCVYAEIQPNQIERCEVKKK